ncbi:N-acetyltransferase family protein [Maritalea sp.]|uniref:GNAT family N-acetyltransferase n=1 Tax=Maritalea sp. TaxID=2003361 RepID=UPI003EF49BC8
MNILAFSNQHTSSIAALYAHYVEHTAITFDVVAPTPQQMGNKLVGLTNAGYPVLVAQNKDKTVCGFAYASAYRPKPAYQHTCEVTIYVTPDAHGQGIGTMLMQSLIETLCQNPHFHLAIAMIADEAQASIHLHKKFGFETVGHLDEVGHKNEKWHGVTIMQRKLDAL